MNRLWLGLSLSLLFSLSLGALSLEEAKGEIQKNNALSEAERTRQIAGLYRLSGQVKESFTLLRESLNKRVFNEWMLEDYAALGAALSQEETVRSTAHALLSSPMTEDKMGGVLLEGLMDLKGSPEHVLERLKSFSDTYTQEEINGLFLTLLSRAYASLGNSERSSYFKDLMTTAFPDYYDLDKKAPATSRPSPPSLIVQVGYFKTEGESLRAFLKRLESLGLNPLVERDAGFMRIRLASAEPENLRGLLKREGIDFFVVQEAPQGTVPPLNWKGTGSTLQVGIFSSLEVAEAQKQALAKDGFEGVQVIYQEAPRLFYLFLETEHPQETLRSLKRKGYDAFIKNLE